jgi:hypothetical protein
MRGKSECHVSPNSTSWLGEVKARSLANREEASLSERRWSEADVARNPLMV